MLHHYFSVNLSITAKNKNLKKHKNCPWLFFPKRHNLTRVIFVFLGKFCIRKVNNLLYHYKFFSGKTSNSTGLFVHTILHTSKVWNFLLAAMFPYGHLWSGCTWPNHKHGFAIQKFNIYFRCISTLHQYHPNMQHYLAFSQSFKDIWMPPRSCLPLHMVQFITHLCASRVMMILKILTLFCQ